MSAQPSSEPALLFFVSTSLWGQETVDFTSEETFLVAAHKLDFPFASILSFSTTLYIILGVKRAAEEAQKCTSINLIFSATPMALGNLVEQHSFSRTQCQYFRIFVLIKNRSNFALRISLSFLGQFLARVVLTLHK